MLLVRDRTLDDQDERIELALLGLVAILHEVVADFVREHRIVQVHVRESGNRAQHHVFDARLGRCGDRDRVAVTPQTAVIHRTWTSETAGAFCVTLP